MDPGVQRLQGPADRPGRLDADSVWQSERDTAGPGHSVQFPAQDPRPHHESKSDNSAGK